MVGDYIDALAESERAVLAPTGEFDEHGQPHTVPTLLASAALLDLHTVRRQILSLGSLAGNPFPVEQLRLLSEADLDVIRFGAEQLAERAPVEVVQRGRPDPADKGGSPPGSAADHRTDDVANRDQADGIQ